MKSARIKPGLVVVDDEEEVLHSLYDLLRLEYQVLPFKNGQLALDTLRTNPVDVAVIMSDQQMPHMQGVQFLMEVKTLRPDATRMLMTGHADIKAVIDAINEGSVSHYIGKPWNPDELIIKIREAAEQHRLRVHNRQLLADLERSNRLKSAFIEVASHELNTPVTVVQGMTTLWKMVQGENAKPQEREWVARIESAANRLSYTVERMLKLLHAGQFENPLNTQEISVESAIQKAIEGVTPFLQIRNQTVHLDIAPNVGRIVADPEKIGDIMTNLIVNAIKFSPDGSVIHTKVGGDEHNIEIQVIDQGLGIDKDKRDHLFEPFFTGYNTLNHSSGECQFGKQGMGLGLCLAKTFAKLHGGDVEAIYPELPLHSSTTPGAVFRVRLPRNPQHVSSVSNPG